MTSSPTQKSWLDTLLLYKDRRLACIFVFGMSSGLPFVLIGSNMSGWLKDAGLTRSAIGLFGSIFAVYSINFLWAPLVDRVRLGFLTRRLGRRKSWIFSMQLIILCACIGISFTNPAVNILWTSLLALLIAIASATKDIAIDGYRIDLLSDDKEVIPAGSCMAIVGWWTGYSLPGYIAFSAADSLKWSITYLIMAAIMLGLMVLGTLMIKEKQPDSSFSAAQDSTGSSRQVSQLSAALGWLATTLIEPFAEFFRRCGWKMAFGILLFVFLFKIGESFLGRMSIVFYREIGFSNEDIATYSKLIGWGATVVFTLIGGYINLRFGIFKGLLVGGIAMAASNLMFAWIAFSGPNTTLFFLTIIIDNFTTAFSTVAFVSFITSLTGRAFSATQYALLASVGTLGRTTMSSLSGVLIDDFLNGSWGLFFIITFFMVFPSLLILLWIRQIEKSRTQTQHQDEAAQT